MVPVVPAEARAAVLARAVAQEWEPAARAVPVEVLEAA